MEAALTGRAGWWSGRSSDGLQLRSGVGGRVFVGAVGGLIGAGVVTGQGEEDLVERGLLDVDGVDVEAVLAHRDENVDGLVAAVEGDAEPARLGRDGGLVAADHLV